VAYDIVTSDMPVVNVESGAVLSVGKDTQVIDIYGINSGKLEDKIIQRDALYNLISNSTRNFW
jgi:hypothetical protein